MILKRYIFPILLIIFSATPSYADAGIPMLALVLPGMIVSLVPIIIIEAWCIRRSLNIAFARSVKVMAVANIESTLIGIPLTWIIWFVIEMILAYAGYQLSASLGVQIPDFVSFAFGLTVGAAWLAPSESQGYWIVPVASLVLLVPFFYVSWLFERRRAKKLLQEFSFESVNGATLKANIYSYGLLAIAVIGWLITAITTKGNV